MSPKISAPISSRPQQRGVSVISAVFLLLLMASLAALMVSLTSTSHLNQAQDVGGTRAYLAARAGIEWGVYRMDPDGAATGTATGCAAALPACFSGVLNAVPGHVVTVACVSDDYTESGVTRRIYKYTATATAAGFGGRSFERQLQATVERCQE